MTINPKISIIVPVYNVEKYLKESLDSLVNQTLKDIEIICVNDGSTDNSLEILNEYANKDERIKIINQENAGSGVSRNIGIKHIQAEYVMFLDSDDYITLTACEKIYNKISSIDCDVLFFDVYRNFYDKVTPLNKIKNLYEKFGDNVFNIEDCADIISNFSREIWYKCYRSEFLIKNNIVNFNARGWEDTYFVYKLYALNPQIAVLNEPLYYYRTVACSLSRTSGKYLPLLFESFKFANDFIIQSDLSDKSKVLFIQKNIDWLNGWCTKALEAKYRKEANKLKKVSFIKLYKTLKKVKLIKYINPDYIKNLKSKLIIEQFVAFLENIFSVKNDYSAQVKRKIINICGLKIKFKVKNKRNKKIKNTQIIPKILEKIIWDNKKQVTNICFSSDENYAPYLYIALYSLIKNTSENNNYDIVVLEKNISRENKNKILALQKENIKIRFYNISDMLEKYKGNFHICAHFKIENYFRIFIPEIFENYDKVLYLDLDMLFFEDIANLYNIDLEGYSIAAAKDLAGLNDFHAMKAYDYLVNVLKLQNPTNYFNSGVMLLDLNKLREMKLIQKCINLLKVVKPWYVDQCILNIILENDVKFLDTKWNVHNHLMEVVNLGYVNYALPESIVEKYKNDIENPSILHFTSQYKPWRVPNIVNAQLFFDCAKECGMYEVVLYKNAILYKNANK